MNTYEVFWERNERQDENLITDGFTLEVEDINEYSKKIVIRADDNVNGIADVYLDACAEKAVGGGYQFNISISNDAQGRKHGNRLFTGRFLLRI